MLCAAVIEEKDKNFNVLDTLYIFRKRGKRITMQNKTMPLFSNRDLSCLIWPLIAEQLLTVTVGIADTVMVSTVGEAAVSGISLVDQINALILQVFAALATGGAVVASQYLGRRDRERAIEASRQLVYVMLILSTAVAVVCMWLNRPLLYAIYGDVDGNVMQASKTYFWLSAWSYPFIALYHAGAAIFRSMGNAKVSFFSAIVMNVINIGGNALFIYGLHWNVAGAALASLLARLAAAVMVVVLLLNAQQTIYLRNLFRPTWNGQLVKNILGIGIPTGLENGMFQVGKLLVARLITGYGTAAIAANTICSNILSVNHVPGNAIGLATVTIVGRCMGANDVKQTKQYTKKLIGITYAAFTIVTVMVYLTAPTVVAFYQVSEQATNLAIPVIQFACLTSVIIWPLAFTLPQALRAAGDAKFTMTVSMISMWAARIAMSVVFGTWLGFGLFGVWLAMVLDWFVRGAFFSVRFLGSKWLSKKVI